MVQFVLILYSVRFFDNRLSEHAECVCIVHIHVYVHQSKPNTTNELKSKMTVRCAAQNKRCKYTSKAFRAMNKVALVAHIFLAYLTAKFQHNETMFSHMTSSSNQTNFKLFSLFI